MNSEFRITGRHVLTALISFFVVVAAVNVVFINFAVRTFPGEKEEKSYLQGLNYNDRLAARAAQDALGWSASIDKAALAGGDVTIALSIVDRNGAPVSGLNVSAVLSRPASEVHDTVVSFRPIGRGEYEAVAPAGAGAWDLEGNALNHREQEFAFYSRLMLQ